MAKHYNLKDKKITVWSHTSKNVRGVPMVTYKKEYSLIWAYYRHDGGSATRSGGNSIRIYDENAAALFVINKRPIEATWLIVYNHKIYEITRIDDYENYNDDIKLLCKMAENQSFNAYKGLVDD